MSKYLLLELVSLASVCSSAMGQIWTGDPELGCSLHIRVVNPFGVAVPYRVKSFVAGNATNINLSSKFHDLDIGPLYGGGYDYELVPVKSDSEFGPKKGRVLVRDKRVWLTVVAYPKLPGDERRAPLNSGGIVYPPPSNGKPAWVRFSAAFDGYVLEEVPMEADGSFKLYHEHLGRFVVTAFSGTDIIALQAVTINPRTRFPLRIESPRSRADK